MALSRLGRTKGRIKKTETYLTPDMEELLCSFIKDCISSTYSIVFPKIYEGYFELHVHDASLSFLTDSKLIELLKLIISVKTSVGSALSHRVSIDRVDAINVKILGDPNVKQGYNFKIKRTEEFDDIFEVKFPELFTSAPKIAEE